MSGGRPARVLLIVSGGIAAYKAPEIVRALIKSAPQHLAGCEVQVVLTAAAAQFTTPLSLATVSGRPVRQSLLDPAEEGTVGHIELADWPDLVLVAPATANLMAKAANGLADDLASTVLLATQADVLWAPAMNTNMWEHPATVDNLQTLARRGASFVGPDAGELACGWVGAGRMMDPQIIADAAFDRLASPAEAKPWAGRRVLVSAGPTRAYLDPVRFFSNASTGAMGFAIAQQAADRGALVTLVAGPTGLPTPRGVNRVDVQTADDMLAAMDEVLRGDAQDLVAMVAAVADLAPAKGSGHKLGKDEMVDALRGGALVEGVDVLATLCRTHADRGFFLGFGAQTVDAPEGDAASAAVLDALRTAGRAKLARKGCDALFVNRVGTVGVGFGSATNTGLLLGASDVEFDAGPPRPKGELARWILERLLPLVSEAAS